MRNEQEVKQLKEQLSKLTGFIAHAGANGELEDTDVKYAVNISAALSWVLDEITTDHFTSESYLNIRRLKHMVRAIEIRTRTLLNSFE